MVGDRLYHGVDGALSDELAATVDSGTGVLHIGSGGERYIPDATASTPESTALLPPAGASVISR